MDNEQVLEVGPNKFYKKIWFWLIVVGTIGFFITVVLFLYTNVLNNTTTAYIVGGLFFAVIAVGVIMSYFSKTIKEPTLKTFEGRDTGITSEKILNMNTAELEDTLSIVSGMPVEAIRAVCDKKMSVKSSLQFLPNQPPPNQPVPTK